MVLYGVEEKRGERVPEEIIHTGGEEARHRHQPPVVPCVYGERHDLGGGVRPEPHEVAVKQADGVEADEHDDQPHHERHNGHALVVEYRVEYGSHGGIFSFRGLCMKRKAVFQWRSQGVM